MATIFSNLFAINGVVSTDKSVMQNLNTLCTASGCWLTFDVNTGLWSVIINSTGSSIKSFTDANIIGAINVSGSGINELYNKVSIEFPHVDLRDQTDYIDMRIPTEQLYPNELENILNIKLDCINNPLQAQQIATQELKQSRVDKIIEFRTDFTSLGLKAGDLIDITSDVYGYTNKMFRIVRMTEEDGDDGTLYVSITALEYDPDVYSNTGLVREERTKKTGIIPKSQNTALTSLDNQATANGIAGLDPALLALLLAALGRGIGSGSGQLSAYSSGTFGASTSIVSSRYNSFVANPEPWSTNGTFTNAFGGVPVAINFSVPSEMTNVKVIVQNPLGAFDYQYKTNGSLYTRNQLIAYFPSAIEIFYNGMPLQSATGDWQTQNTVFLLPTMWPGNYTIRLSPLPTYDLNQEGSEFIMPYNFVCNPQSSGAGVTVTLESNSV